MSKKQTRLGALERQVERLKRRIQILDERSNRYSWIRLAIFVVGLVLSVAVGALVHWWLGVILAIVTFVSFSIVAYVHRKIDRSLTRHRVLRIIKETQIARITLNWQGIPAVGAAEPQPGHPFETDLDITGARSLHQLLNTGVSREGTQRLRDWLLCTSPDPEVIHQRQTLVQELALHSFFRDKLLLKSIIASQSVAAQWEGKRLLQWLEAEAQHTPSSLRTTLIISSVLSAISIVLFMLNVFWMLPAYWIIALVITIGFTMSRGKERGDLFEDAYLLHDAFEQLGTVFEYLETYRYGQQQQLKKLCEPFFQDRERNPSMLLKRVSRLIWAAGLGKNGLLWLILNALTPWDTSIAMRLTHYKTLIAAQLPVWLDIWFELEALSSLASFAYLNPDYTFPDVTSDKEPNGQVLFQGTSLGHPLIPEEQKVVNDFTLDHLGKIVIITGSNMAGKSTFLRTLGVNLCLTYAGGPVNAQRLHTALFRLFTCIRVSDSVTDGYSYFYAEVRRLKALLVALEQKGYPLFFLIDEIFKGTNNRERLIGSRSYLHSLVGRNCIGVVSTHDLELVTLADTLPDITNDHFREEVVDGQMVFDYRLRPGPSPTTNALKIMQLEGLPVEP